MLAYLWAVGGPHMWANVWAHYWSTLMVYVTQRVTYALTFNTCFGNQNCRMHILIKVGTLLELKTAVDVNTFNSMLHASK